VAGYHPAEAVVGLLEVVKERGKPCAQPIYQYGDDVGYWMLESGAASTIWGVAGAMMRMVVVVGCVC